MKTRFKLVGMALIASLTLPVAAEAQTREIRRDRQEVREQQRDVRQARRAGAPRSEVRNERRDVQRARQETREDRRDYRQDRRQDARNYGRNDWRSYRQTNRNLYRGGNWNAPFRYRSFNIGVSIAPSYYGSRYYVNDYSRYRLAAPGRNLRYIRHYNDVLLVNVRTGRVVQVYRNFYW